MTPHIVSWGRNEDSEWVAPVVSSAGTASVVSIESLLSAPHTTPNPSVTSGVSGARLTGSRSRPASFLGKESTESETPAGSRWQNGDSFLRSRKYFFGDGNVTFLVDGFLYCVHRYFFSRDSVYFSTRFTQLGVRDHEAISTIVSLGDVECDDFEAFLSVLYPENFEEHDLSFEQWRSVLHLSTRWGFASLRKLALASIKPPSSYDRLLLARKYAVDHWVVPALTALCSRTAPLSLDEACGMGMEDVVLVASVREEIRSQEIRSGVSLTEISSRVLEVMGTGAPIPVEGNEVSPSAPTSGGTEQRPGSTLNATVGPGLGARSRNDIETTATAPVKSDTSRGGWLGAPVKENTSMGGWSGAPTKENTSMGGWGALIKENMLGGFSGAPVKNDTPMDGWLVTPSTESQGKNVEQEAKEVQIPVIKPKKKKHQSKAATDGLNTGIGTWGSAGSSARTESEGPTKQGYLDGQASEAPAPQTANLPPQPPAAPSIFGGMGVPFGTGSPYSGS